MWLLALALQAQVQGAPPTGNYAYNIPTVVADARDGNWHIGSGALITSKPIFEAWPTNEDIGHAFDLSGQPSSWSLNIRCKVDTVGNLGQCQGGGSPQDPKVVAIEAALAYLIPKFRLKAIDKDGVSIVGRTIVVPILVTPGGQPPLPINPAPTHLIHGSPR